VICEIKGPRWHLFVILEAPRRAHVIPIGMSIEKLIHLPQQTCCQSKTQALMMLLESMWFL